MKNLKRKVQARDLFSAMGHSYNGRMLEKCRLAGSQDVSMQPDERKKVG